ncbi:MAG: TIGR02281 family clan AA aspartic protease [Betaproteobacteria bacterium]|nr:TIGR02281 family clan AA aspartic protease [Betaproteobacteria bacterium]
MRLRNARGIFRHCTFRMAAAFSALSLSTSVYATTVMVMTLGDGKAQIIINGSTIRSMTEGQTSPEGVTLVSANPKGAVLIVDGKSMSFGLGGSTVSRTELIADRRGQYFTTAYINGIAARSQIDTGATNVAINSEDAARMGIDFSRSKPVIGQTANGQVRGYSVMLRSVQVGDIVLTNVQGTVLEGGRAQLSEVLIGMSFLKQVEMRRSGERMELIKSNY